jgi:uncharacterized protein YjgD (DUF1641 family)
MAQPLRKEVPPRDLRADAVARLQRAPAEHAEALLAGIEVLQLLHDRGVLELLRGVLGSGDRLVELAVDAASTPDAQRALRNLSLLVKALGEMEPAFLCDVTRAVPVALQRASDAEAHPPGLAKLLSTFLNKDFRRGLAAANNLFIELGRNLSAKGGAS